MAIWCLIKKILVWCIYLIKFYVIAVLTVTLLWLVIVFAYIICLMCIMFFFSYLNKYKCIKYMLKFCYVCVKCKFMSIILSFLKYEAFTVTRMCTKYDFSLKVYLNLFLKP